MLLFSPFSVVNAGIIFFGYVIQNSLLQFYFYCVRRKDINSWKTQPEKNQYLGRFWFLPLLSNKPGRAFGHTYITTFNLLMATAFAFVVSELCIRGQSKMVFEQLTWGRIALDLLIAYVYENIAEVCIHPLSNTPSNMVPNTAPSQTILEHSTIGIACFICHHSTNGFTSTITRTKNLSHSTICTFIPSRRFVITASCTHHRSCFLVMFSHSSGMFSITYSFVSLFLIFIFRFAPIIFPFLD